jgi:hypothetical protein
MSNLLIDCYTRSARTIVGKLRRLKTTKACNFNGVYREDKSLCQVIVNTSKTESELEAWLHKLKGVDYVGVCETEKECDSSMEMDDADWEEATGIRPSDRLHQRKFS